MDVYQCTAEFLHGTFIVVIWEVERITCYVRGEIFTEAVASVASVNGSYPVHAHRAYSLLSS